MAKSFPCHNFLAESLRQKFVSLSKRVVGVVKTAYARNFIKITHRVHSQNLNCDSTTLVFTRPHVRKPTTVKRDIRSIVAKRDLE